MERRIRSTINEELGELEKRIHTLRLREDEIQALIETTYRLKDSVTTERLGLQSKGLELQAEREPINWLPPELLIHIFIAFCELDSTENTHRAPVVLSHVCRKWRNITTQTPHLWRRVLMQTFADSEHDVVQTQLKRSGTVPLEIAFRSARRNMPNSEVHQVANLLVAIKAHLQRTERFTLHCNNVMPFVYLAPVLKNHIARFPLLYDLSLSVGTSNPTFLEALSLLNARWPQDDSEPPKGTAESYTSPLRRLKLEQIPLFSIPKLFVLNLQTLELSFPESRSQARHQYRLKMSVLGRFLRAMPLLEELILNNTLPIFDAILPIPKDTTSATISTTTTSTPANAGAAEGNPSPWVELAPIKLEHLTSIAWTFATASAVHEIFAFLHCPALERLDLWLERSSYSSSRSSSPNDGARDTNYIRGGLPVQSDAADARPPAVRGVLDFPCLRELDLQYPGEDTLASVLRRLRMPVLERAAFTEVETDPAGVLVSAVVSDMPQAQASLPRAQGRLRSRAPGVGPSGPSSSSSSSSSSSKHDHTHTFPRLEAILFDPRLTHLTHLTLSHQRIARDAQRAEALLGYMPVLSSLSLDACTGVRWLLAGLSELVHENGGRGAVAAGVAVATPTDGGERNEEPDARHEGGDARVVRVRRGVKVCPRLEALSFWDCPDVDSASVRKVVMARNKQAGELVALGEAARPSTRAGPSPGARTGASEEATARATAIGTAGDSADGIGAAGNSTGADTLQDGNREASAPDQVVPVSGSSSSAGSVAVTGGTGALARKIKPLRRPRSEFAATVGGVSCPSLPSSVGGGPRARLASTNIVSKMIAIEESFRPAHIIYLRVANCVLIDEDDLLALRDLDVVDVIWAGQEVD